MAQTSVATRPTRAFAGMLGDSSHMKNVRSYVSTESSAEIPFGVMCVRDATNKDTGALLPHTSAAASSDIMVGVVVHSHAYDKPLELGDTGIKPKCTLNILTHGRIWVPVEETVAPGDAVRVRVVAAGAEQKGAFRTTADSTDTVNITAFARWVTGGAAGSVAELEVDMTDPNGTAD